MTRKITPANARPRCTKVAVIGDSKSEARIGARNVIIDELRGRGMPYFVSVSSGRTIQRPGFGTDKRHGSGISAVGHAKAAGANCFVMAIGGNDAMRARGNHATMRRDIDAMMSAVGPDYTVDWVTSTSGHYTGRWAKHTLQQFTVELDRARGRWRNLEVNHWERVPEYLPDWWRSDLLHYRNGNIPRGRYTVESAFLRGSR
ncbi:MAG: hypothetical protein WAW85_04055 [Gordonia sp. (in: high G+C Gram-positive bacteria)]|uniref:hypothetical protein n=1 Tax=Gordonia sp. (in: high G+C Gram-positive bacteria) TaxID=84139 RepID=UPI003BB5D47D